ncbi:hypothetical protein Aperf_G00000008156 [Anoplocephala perfoliata]
MSLPCSNHFTLLCCYARSKLANTMYAQYLSGKLESEGIQTASVNPGLVRSEAFRTAKLNEIYTQSLEPIYTSPNPTTSCSSGTGLKEVPVGHVYAGSSSAQLCRYFLTISSVRDGPTDQLSNYLLQQFSARNADFIRARQSNAGNACEYCQCFDDIFNHRNQELCCMQHGSDTSKRHDLLPHH